jgi:dsDNA-specific endonuclease/ATPase MutS2
MQLGDRVAVIDDTLEGIITKIKGDQITFLSDDGFDYTFSKNQLALMPKDFNPSNIKPPVSKTSDKSIKKTKPPKQPNTPVFDLHIEKILPRHHHLSSGQKLQMQIDEFDRILYKLQRQHYKEAVFIHGQGTGKLKQEIIKMLKSKGMQYAEAPYAKFGKGALLVFLK